MLYYLTASQNLMQNGRINENLLQQINSDISKYPNNIELRFKKLECFMFLQNYYLSSKEYEFVLRNSEKLNRFENEIINIQSKIFNFAKSLYHGLQMGPKIILAAIGIIC